MTKKIAKPSRLSKLGEIVKSVDMFGTSVGFHVRGGDAFKTWFGAFLSIIIIYSSVVVYGSSKFQKMYYRLDTTHQQSALKEGTYDTSKYNFTFSEIDFQIQIGVFSKPGYLAIPIDELSGFLEIKAS